MHKDPDVPWPGQVLFTGYLTATRVRRVKGEMEVRLEIPNHEVRYTYRTLFKT